MALPLMWCVCRAVKRRYSGVRLAILGCILGLGFIITIYSQIFQPDQQQQLLHYQTNGRTRHLLFVNETANVTGPPPPPKMPTSSPGLYPNDIFTEAQLKSGAVILHCLGLIYMFIALAIVCDEFFVPTLGVIIDRLNISDDVAGATFMAAGGSAPELFTSLIGVHFARNDVGISTIVGSAVFNILFVIGMCAIFSKTVLSLTWWPLFRDVVFYSCSLIILLLCFMDSKIQWYESLMLLAMYFFYVLFMKFNVRIEQFVKSRLSRTIKTISVAEPAKEIVVPRNRRHSVPHFRNTNMFRHGALQLMLHTIDPLSETVHVHEKAVQMRAIAKSCNNAEIAQTNGHTQMTPSNNHQETNMQDMTTPQTINNGSSLDLPGVDRGVVVHGLPSRNDHSSSRECILGAEHLPDELEQNGGRISTISHPNIPEDDDSPATPTGGRTVSVDMVTQSTLVDDTSQSPTSQEIPEIEEEEEPLDISWPPTCRKRITYILLAPLIFPMWLTLPDVRRETSRKWYPISFIVSIMWIAFFSYLMVWWATVIGETVGIQNQVMGLTFLAAGTSIPDLITSVIVARKGLGDMAVSSSVGSNIFDITVGLPFPWLLFNAIQLGEAVVVNSTGLFCSVFLLFALLLLVIFIIAVSKWKMTKTFGAAMFVLYAFFITISLLLELDYIPCLLQSS
ncbi:sodium/potassium/calcium exchanger 2-like [Asterias amurensis]|uniref:sodium/potassium/calcium exchanger 2-like n=1 Tax=Asterias amurensis TaxID=7602 RepID=UPI003AB6CEC4